MDWVGNGENDAVNSNPLSANGTITSLSGESSSKRVSIIVKGLLGIKVPVFLTFSISALNVVGTSWKSCSSNFVVSTCGFFIVNSPPINFASKSYTDR